MTTGSPSTTSTKRRTKGEGSIRFREAQGNWEGRIQVDGHSKSVYGATQREVRRKLTEMMRDRDQGLPFIRDEQSLAQFYELWSANTAANLEVSTHKRYGELFALHILPALGKTKLTKLTPQQIEHVYARKRAEGLSPTTVHHIHRALHTALEKAVRLGLVARNPCDAVDAPKQRHAEMHPLDERQAQRLLAAAQGHRLYALYVLAITTGMRQGELLGLRWKALDWHDGSLSVTQTLKVGADGRHVFGTPKTKGSRRRIKLTPIAISALQAHRERQQTERKRAGDVWREHDLVFCNTMGGPINPSNLLNQMHKPLLRRAELPMVRFHDLRHTCATVLLSRRVNPKMVSELLGHASIAITLDLYSHVLPDMQQDVAAAIDAVFPALPTGPIVDADAVGGDSDVG